MVQKYFSARNIFFRKKYFSLQEIYFSPQEKYFLRKKIFLAEKYISCGEKFIFFAEKNMFLAEKNIFVIWPSWLQFIGPLGRKCSPLQWRRNEHDGVSNHRCYDRLFKSLFRYRSKKISKLRVTGLCEGNSPVTGEFPAQLEGPVMHKCFHLMTSSCVRPMDCRTNQLYNIMAMICKIKEMSDYWVVGSMVRETNGSSIHLSTGLHSVVIILRASRQWGIEVVGPVDRRTSRM